MTKARVRSGPWLAAVFLAGMADGCASTSVPSRLGVSTLRAVRATDAHIFVPERQITVDWSPYSAAAPSGQSGQSGRAIGVAMGTAIGVAIVNAVINIGRESAAIGRAAALRAVTGDIDFQQRYAYALAPVLKGERWLRLQKIQRSSSVAFNPQAKKPRMNSVLSIDAWHVLTSDSRMLSVGSRLAYYPVDTSSEAAVMSTIYLSGTISAEVKDEDAIERWKKDNAAAYRASLEEGIAENLLLTRLALDHMAGTDYAGVKVELHVRQPGDRDDTGTRHLGFLAGTVVSASVRRVLLQTDGGFYSIPKNAIASTVVIGRVAGAPWFARQVPGVVDPAAKASVKPSPFAREAGPAAPLGGPASPPVESVQPASAPAQPPAEPSTTPPAALQTTVELSERSL